MSWDAVGAIGEIVGALAVLITILFLARQISSGASLAKTSVRSELMASYGTMNDLIASTPEIAAILTKLGNFGTALTPEETV